MFFLIWDRTDKMHCISELEKPGDIIFFDGNLLHKIKPIKGNLDTIELFEIPTFKTKQKLKRSLLKIFN